MRPWCGVVYDHIERDTGSSIAHASSCWLVEALSTGVILEPILHPKPGAVTRLRSHDDKNLVDFAVHSLPVRLGMMTACESASGSGIDPIADGLRVYRASLLRLGIDSNIGLGTALLMIPLSASLGHLGYPAPPERITEEARRICRSATPMAAREYYDILHMLRPSHLREYTGPVPAVGEGYPSSFSSILEVASWDLVHRELHLGYKVTLSTYRRIMGLIADGYSLEEASLVALLEVLSTQGDTLILAKYGIRAFQRAKIMAMRTLKAVMRDKSRIYNSVDELDSEWRRLGWNPGASLDVLAAALGLLFYDLTRSMKRER